MKQKGKRYSTILKKILSVNQSLFYRKLTALSQVENLWRHQWHGNMSFSHGTSNSRESETRETPVFDNLLGIYQIILR